MPVVCVDAGTTLVKAVGFGDDGRELAVERQGVTVDRPSPGWAEQDMAAVSDAVSTTVRAVVAQLGGTVSFLAITAQGDGCWLVNEDGAPTGPAVLWNDSRGSAHIRAWLQAGVLDEAFRINGSLASAGLPNAILTWFQDEQPQRLRKSASSLTCGGWLFSELTGTVAADESDAAAPFLDINTRKYSDRLLELYDMRWARRLLPQVLGDDERVAPLSAGAAQRTGLPSGLPVVLAPYDIASTALGAGAVAVGQTCTILGTTLCTEVVTDVPRLDGPAAGLTIPSGAPGRVLRAFPTLAGTGVLQWTCSLLGLATAAELGELAARSPVGANGLSLLPYLSPGGERAPFLDPLARGSLSGMTLEHTRADVARAVFEGLSLVVQDCLLASGTASSELRVSGGGAASNFWLQMIADTTGVPVLRSTDTEVGARGAMLVGAVATGTADDLEDAAAEHVRARDVFRPDDATTQRYRRSYEDFLVLRAAQQDTWQSLPGRSAGTGGSAPVELML